MEFDGAVVDLPKFPGLALSKGTPRHASRPANPKYGARRQRARDGWMWNSGRAHHRIPRFKTILLRAHGHYAGNLINLFGACSNRLQRRGLHRHPPSASAAF
jgi:hypothetical protein